jgi:hypothetical protein
MYALNLSTSQRKKREKLCIEQNDASVCYPNLADIRKFLKTKRGNEKNFLKTSKRNEFLINTSVCKGYETQKQKEHFTLP